MLKNIEGITKEELDTISKKVALDKYDEVVLSPDDWIEKDEIRYLKTPIFQKLCILPMAMVSREFCVT